ncbi:MAG: hypothetical protein WC707_03935 [Candidatus Babeliaceae bacterium]
MSTRSHSKSDVRNAQAASISLSISSHVSCILYGAGCCPAVFSCNMWR